MTAPGAMTGHELFQAVLATTRAFAAACRDAGEQGRETRRSDAVRRSGEWLDALLAEVARRLGELDARASWTQARARMDAAEGRAPYADPLTDPLIPEDGLRVGSRNDPT